MKVYNSTENKVFEESSIALGFFDGVHLGHQSVIEAAIAFAKSNNMPCAVVTFKDHPRSLVQNMKPKLLMSVDQRLDQFEKLGVDSTLLLSFTQELCNLSAHDYVVKILKGIMGARYISIGQNHHFGKDRGGDSKLLQSMSQENFFLVHVSPILKVGNTEVSSTIIRENLTQGNIEIIKKLLGRDFSLKSTVVKGNQRGRTIGFPTANLIFDESQVLPKNGVYAAWTQIDNVKYEAVVNIGLRPTFLETQNYPLIEAHILGYSGDLYDSELEINLIKFIRPEVKFDSVELLISQISKDVDQTRSLNILKLVS